MLDVPLEIPAPIPERDRSMKSPALLPRLLAAASVLVFHAAARAETATAERTPSFLRSIETEEKQSAIQTSSIEYRPESGKGPNIWLVAVAHLGTPAYYAAIQKRLDAQTVVLFEGVGVGDQLKQGPGAATHDNGIQKELADALGLKFQLDAIDYRRDHFINSDLAPDGVEERVHDRTGSKDDTKPNPAYDLIIGAIRGAPETMEMLRPMLGFITSSPEMRETVRLMLVEVLARADEMVDLAKGISPEMKDLFDVLLTERNAIVIRDLRNQVARLGTGQTVAIFYGAAHMPEIARRLRKDLKYTAGPEQWDTAFTADPAKSPIQPAQMRLLIDMVRNQVKQSGGQLPALQFPPRIGP
jgi:hypothetical protein